MMTTLAALCILCCHDTHSPPSQQPGSHQPHRPPSTTILTRHMQATCRAQGVTLKLNLSCDQHATRDPCSARLSASLGRRGWHATATRPAVFVFLASPFCSVTLWSVAACSHRDAVTGRSGGRVTYDASPRVWRDCLSHAPRVCRRSTRPERGSRQICNSRPIWTAAHNCASPPRAVAATTSLMLSLSQTRPAPPDGGPMPLRTFHSAATSAPSGARNVFTTPQRHASVFHSVLVRLGAKRVGATSSTSLAACLAHVACLAVGLPRRRLARWLPWSLSKQLATPCAWPGGHAHTLGRHHRPLPIAPARIEAGHHMLRPVPIAPSEACCRVTLLGSHHLRSSLPHTLRALQTQLQTHPRAQLHCQARPANTANVRPKLSESSAETIHPVQCR